MTTIADLTPDDKNFNKHTQKGMGLLEKSLNQYGAGRSILIDKNNRIIAGNGIVEAAGSVGLEDVQIVESDGKKIIAVKRTDVDLDWDFGAMQDVGLKKEDVENWIDDVSGWDSEPEEIVEDEVPEPEAETTTKVGDIFQLGNHRLMCGDSTKQEDVETLMGGVMADMVFTDPPYNMAMGGGGCFEKSVERMVDRTSGIVDFDAHSIEWLSEQNRIKNIMIFTSKDLVPEYLKMFGKWEFNILVWTKSNPTPFTHNVFLPDVEYLLYFYKQGRVWENSVKPTNVYSKFYNSSKTEGREGVGDLHPTMKPQGILCDKIKILSKNGGVVLDLFGGSGSTLIACEQLNRKCYMMELDPHYCDVIIKRWENFTGEKARKIDG